MFCQEKKMAFPYLPETRVGHTALANEMQLRVSGEIFADLIHALPLSLFSCCFPLAWNVAVSLEVRQPHCDYEVTRVRMKVMEIRMVGAKRRIWLKSLILPLSHL